MSSTRRGRPLDVDPELALLSRIIVNDRLSERWRAWRRAAKNLAESGSPEAVYALLHVFHTTAEHWPDKAPFVEDLLLKAVKGQKEIDMVCEYFMDRPASEGVRQLIEAHSWRPSDPHRRALMLFHHLGDYAAYDELDFDGRLLAAVFETATPSGRGGIAASARASGRMRWLNRLTEMRQRRLGELSYGEWSVLLHGHVAATHWDELWQIARKAPPMWSTEMLFQLDAPDWRPADDSERAVFEELIRLVYEMTEPPPPFGDPIRLEGTDADEFSDTFQVSSDTSLVIGSHRPLGVWHLPSAAWIDLTAHQAASSPDGQGGWFGHALSPDGSTLAIGFAGGEIKLWRVPEGRPAGTLHSHQTARQLMISPDNTTLVSGSFVKPEFRRHVQAGDGTVRLWRLPDGEPTAVLEGHGNSGAIAFVDRDEETLLATSDGTSVRLWRLPDGAPAGSLPFVTRPDTRIERLATSLDRTTLVAISSWDRDDRILTVKAWPGLHEHSALSIRQRFERVVPEDIAVSPDGMLLAGRVGENRLCLWDLRARDAIEVLSDTDDSTGEPLAFTPEGRFLIDGGGSALQGTRIWPLPWAGSRRLAISDARLLPVTGGAILVGRDVDTRHVVVLPYRPSALDELDRKPVSAMTDVDVQELSRHRDDEGERSTAAFISALVRHHRAHDVELADAEPDPTAVELSDTALEPET